MTRCLLFERPPQHAGVWKEYEVSISSADLQTNGWPPNSEFSPHILTNRGATTTKILFVGLAKRYRVFISFVSGKTATDSDHYLASSVAWAQPTMVAHLRPGPHPP